MDKTLDGLIIREVLINDNDKLLTVLTGELGKITVLAKGVKALKSKNSPSVQMFCYSTFEMNENNGRYTLKTAYLKESFYALRDNVLRFALSSYVVDVLSALCTENTDESEMLRLALNTLYAIAKQQDKPPELVKAVFELKALAIAGFMPDLQGCGACGEELSLDDESGNPENKNFLDKNKKVSFYLLEGSMLCNNCLSDEEAGFNGDYILKLSLPAVMAMKYILCSPQNKMLSFRLSDIYIDELSAVCEKFLIIQTDRRFETLKFYKETKENNL